jgi:hypothetical protein
MDLFSTVAQVSPAAPAAPFRETKYWKYVLEPAAASTQTSRVATPPETTEVVEGKRQRVSPARLIIDMPSSARRDSGRRNGAAQAFQKPKGRALEFRKPAPQVLTPRKPLKAPKAPTPGAERWDPFVVGYDVYVEGSRAWVPSRVL